MANDDLQQEIELLRKQLNAMKTESEAKSDGGPIELESDDQAPEIEASPSAIEETVETGNGGEPDLGMQFKKLLDSLDADIKDTKPTTLLAVFALGVLVGRL